MLNIMIVGVEDRDLCLQAVYSQPVSFGRVGR